MRLRNWLPSIACCAALALDGAPSIAAPLSTAGITFSDELGGFTIRSVSGTGSLVDPIVVVEEITGPQEAVLVITGFSAAFGNRIGTHHLTGFALRKIVTNRTEDVWNLFELELRETLAHQSPYSDGLSFGQASSVGRPFRSDVFASHRDVDEPLDSVAFSDGAVQPGETVTFDLIVTDTSPISPFLLLQQPTQIVAAAPRAIAARPEAR
ncbi:MAG: hypothetical protein AB7S71_01815 [Dongiaceae bacterium]